MHKEPKEPSADPITADLNGRKARRARWTIKRAESVCRDLYGIQGKLEKLASERDELYCVKSRTGESFLLRISGEQEALAAICLQNRALEQIAASDPILPVPRLVRSVRGNATEVYKHHGEESRLRLFTFLRGVPILDRPRSPSLLRDIGRSVARLDQALSGLEAGDTIFPLIWDVTRASALRPLLIYIDNKPHRQLAEEVLIDLEVNAFCQLLSLKSQIIHNDCNPKNILIELANPNHVVGIIDFGDMIVAPRIVDLGVSIARNIDTDDVLGSAGEIAKGYSSVLPLLSDEIEVLFTLVCTRLAMRSIIWSWRAARNDSRCDHKQISNAFTLLEMLKDLGKPRVTQELMRSAS